MSILNVDRPYAIIEAPSILGLKDSGVDELPGRLLEEGLATRIQGKVVRRLRTLEYRAEREPQTLTLNAHAIAQWTPQLADAISDVVDEGQFPLVLGGDCSIVLGSTLALKRRGRYGLLFIDGHADFYQPEVNPNGEAASMDLAFATGYGPALLTDIEGRRPLVRAEDVSLFGYRDAEEQAQYGSQSLPRELRAFDLQTVRRNGIEATAREAVANVTRADLDGFFIHLDADSLNDAIMPAVDYRLEGGLSWEELIAVLRIAIGSGKAVGLEVAIYNPKLDRDGSAGRGLAHALADALGTSAPWH
jgi:arginase